MKYLPGSIYASAVMLSGLFVAWVGGAEPFTFYAGLIAAITLALAFCIFVLVSEDAR